MPSRPNVRFAAFEYQPSRRRLLIDGRPARLGARAIDLLEALLDRRDRTVGKAELLDIVWPDVVVEEANLHVQVSALRKVLGAGVIATVPGRGYRFVAPVEGEASAPTSRPEAAVANPGNIASNASPLIGRDDALATLETLLRAHPVVTVVGAGGVGKSRLATTAAHRIAGDFADGAWLVDAASIDDGADLAGAVAQALRVPLALPRNAARLAAALANRSLLIVLDNCEHVVAGAADIVASVRASAPSVRFLATSQQPLGCAGETVMRLDPLALPAEDAAASERDGAIALFVARARAAHEGFVLDASNAVAAAQICRELDGLPLAIELAAARVRLLGVTGVRDRLHDRLRLLTTGAPTVAPRQQTLRAALEWSHALLDGAEKAVLRRLGVFAGGFSLEVAQAVAMGDAVIDGWSVLDNLGTLIEKSLVAVDPGEPVRYRLLETVRAFALEQLDAHGEREATCRRHARAMAHYYASIDEARWGDSGTMTAEEALRLLVPEVDNARTALDWSVRAEDWPTAITLAGASATAFFYVGRMHDIVARMQSMLAHLSAASPLARVLLLTRLGSMGSFADLPRDQLHAIKLQAAEQARTGGHRRRLLMALSTLASGLVSRDELDAAEALTDEMAQLARPDDPSFVAGLRYSIVSTIHIRRHELREAAAALGQQRSLLLAPNGDAGALATTEFNLSTVLNALGRHEEALDVAVDALARATLPRSFYAPLAYQRLLALAALGRTEDAHAVAREARSEFERAASVFRYGCEALATLAFARGRLDDASRIEAALLAYIDRVRGERHPLTLGLREQLEAARRRSGIAEETAQQWRIEGEAMTGPAIIALAIGEAAG